MNKDREELQYAAELMAAHMIEVVKRLDLDQITIPIVDEACVWELKVTKMVVQSEARQE